MIIKYIHYTIDDATNDILLLQKLCGLIITFASSFHIVSTILANTIPNNTNLRANKSIRSKWD